MKNEITFTDTEIEIFAADAGRELTDAEIDNRIGIELFTVEVANTDYPEDEEQRHPYDEQYFNYSIHADLANPAMLFAIHPYNEDNVIRLHRDTQKEISRTLSDQAWDDYHARNSDDDF